MAAIEPAQQQLRVISSEERFVRTQFSKHYSSRGADDVPRISEREFGFGSWEKKIESRHFSFQNIADLNAHLARNAPFYVSVSTAYYKYPEGRPMGRKDWLGAEIVFDLDADHLGLPCFEQHGKEWVCDACLSAVKHETIRLIEDFLVPDFGLKSEELLTNFSGNRGYHVHVLSKAFESLDARARRELTDYVTGTGLDHTAFFYEKTGKRVGPKPSDGGWGARIASSFLKTLSEKKLCEDLRFLKTDAKKIYKIEENEREQKKDGIERSFRSVTQSVNEGSWDWLQIKNADQVFDSLVQRSRVQLSDPIDQNVTADATKLIRLPGSIHGGSGLVAASLKNLGDYDPLKQALGHYGSGVVRVHVKKSPTFRIGEQTFGPFEKQNADLPLQAAIYLLCKKAATLGSG